PRVRAGLTPAKFGVRTGDGQYTNQHYAAQGMESMADGGREARPPRLNRALVCAGRILRSEAATGAQSHAGRRRPLRADRPTNSARPWPAILEYPREPALLSARYSGERLPATRSDCLPRPSRIV